MAAWPLLLVACVVSAQQYVDSNTADPNVCDPWRTGILNVATDYDRLNSTCPTEWRSISGCGDFENDTRSLQCTSRIRLLDGCTDRNMQMWPKPDGLTHFCIGDRIPYTEWPPRGNGQHRSQWAKHGAYSYLPPQRWLHNVEHGSVAVLYHQCLADADICRLKKYILSRTFDALPIRWVMTPSKDLRLPMALVTYQATYYSDCYNEGDMNTFLERHYRWGWEDVVASGKYNNSWVSDQLCPGDSLPSTIVSLRGNEDADALPVGLGVGLGVGLPLLFITLAGIYCYVHRPKPTPSVTQADKVGRRRSASLSSSSTYESA